jgi:hypothetical protein
MSAYRFHPISSLNFAFSDAKNGNSEEKEFFNQLQTMLLVMQCLGGETYHN